MKFMLSLGLIWTLLNTAEALQCLTCRNPGDLQCTRTVSRPCADRQQCASAALKLYLMGGTTQQIIKDCVPAEVCGSGTQTFSTSLGFGRIVGSIQCCNTDNCNSQNMSVPADQASNGLRCVSCDSESCRNTLQCVGVEDRCFKGSVMAGPIVAQTFGCASTNLCAVASQLPSMFGPNFTRVPITCCDGNLCNSVANIRLSVFPLLLGLISLIFMY